MKLYTINTGYFKLDGGAMFGVVPKSIWNNLNPADENNMCTWALRCLLVEDGNRLILIDNGIGDKQSAKFFSHYYLHGNDTLSKSLAGYGFSVNDVTDIFLTHLHFDHCGGSIKYNSNQSKLELMFPNAVYWSNEGHWKWATQPNKREKASFLKENILPIQESGHLQFFNHGEELIPGFKALFVSGHTDQMMIPLIQYQNRTIAYMADLLPSVAHIPIPYVMAYDTQPLLSLSEKETFLQQAIENDYILYFEHDPKIECCTLKNTERGIRQDECFNLQEALVF